MVPVLSDLGNARIISHSKKIPSKLREDSQQAAGEDSQQAAGERLSPGANTIEMPMTSNMTTFWYAAPEQLVPEYQSYNLQADVWSMGMVFAEIECGYPLCAGSEEDWSKQLCQVYLMWSSLLVDRACATKFEVCVQKAVLEREDFGKIPAPFHQELLGTAAGGAYRRFVTKLLELDPHVRLPSQSLERTFTEMVAQPAAPNEGPLGQRVEASIVDEEGQPAASNKPGSVAALLYDPGDCKTAKYCNNSAPAYMEAVAASGLRVPLTPQPVVNWLYQVLAIALQTTQGFGCRGQI